jgi:hypothetical protein
MELEFPRFRGQLRDYGPQAGTKVMSAGNKATLCALSLDIWLTSAMGYQP